MVLTTHVGPRWKLVTFVPGSLANWGRIWIPDEPLPITAILLLL